MRVLVTGGAGFIGRQLVPQLLHRDHEVTVVDALTENIHGADPSLPDEVTVESRFVKADVRDPGTWAILAEVRPDAIVHLAAETGVGQSMYEVGRYTDVNVQGTAAMLDGVRNHTDGVGRIVLASSRAVYGEGSYRCDECGVVTPDARPRERLEQGLWEPLCPTCGGDIESVPTDEDAPRRPTSVYAMTKVAQEDLVSIVGPTLGGTTAILRFGNVYGEGQPLTNPYTGVLSAFALRLIGGQAPKVYEDGEESRDFVHVSDVARATTIAAEVVGNTCVNIVSGKRWTLRQIAVSMCAELGSAESPEVSGDFRVGDVRHFVGALQRGTEQLRWQPQVDLNDGLARFSRWANSAAERPRAAVAEAAESNLAQRGLFGTASTVGSRRGK